MGNLFIELTNPIEQINLDRLRSVAGTGPVLILTHDNPDPDALASGKALATLFREAWGISGRLVYSGLVARAENQAVLKRLTPEWEHSDVLPDFKEYTAITQVDTQPGAGNNRLNTVHPRHIVIDHHYPVRERLDTVSYSDSNSLSRPVKPADTARWPADRSLCKEGMSNHCLQTLNVDF